MSQNIVAIIFPALSFSSTPFFVCDVESFRTIAYVSMLLTMRHEISSSSPSRLWSSQSGGHSVKLLLVGQMFRHLICCTPWDSRVVHWQCTKHGHLRSWMSPVIASAINVCPDQRVLCYRRTACDFIHHAQPTICKITAPFPHLLDGHHICTNDVTGSVFL
jgi:hypothetical protein